MPELLPEIGGVACATLLYLVFDTYPIVKSFMATFRSGSFYLFWVILSILNLIAFGILRISAADKITKAVGESLAPMTLVLLATIGTIGILQSLTLKVADYKFVDLGRMIEGYRSAVLADINRREADRTRLQSLNVARKLSTKYPLARLRSEYAAVMTYQGRNAAQVGQELTQLQADCVAANISFERAICERIAQADIGQARQLLNAP
jgi:hypothetical protein